MGGHGTTLGGIIVDGGRFPWRDHARRFPMFNQPDASYHGLVYVDHFGEAAYIARCRSVYQRTTGAVLPALSAFLLLQGIETVALRVERHVENGRRVAEFLRDDPRVDWVNYVGFPDNPYRAPARPPIPRSTSVSPTPAASSSASSTTCRTPRCRRPSGSSSACWGRPPTASWFGCGPSRCRRCRARTGAASTSAGPTPGSTPCGIAGWRASS